MGNDLVILRETTVLCRVSGNAYGMARVDRLTKARAVQDGALSADAKVLVPTAAEFAKAHAELVAVQYAARLALRNMSMPYGDEEGWRIMPHSLLAEFLKEFTTLKGKFNTYLSRLKAELIPRMVTQGQHYDETDATAKADLDAKALELTEAYTLVWRMQDYPANLFAGLPEKTAGTLASRHEDEMARVVATVRSHPLRRLAEPVQHLLDRLISYEVDLTAPKAGNSRVSLRSSMVENVQAACQLARRFNIYNLPEVEDVVAKAEVLAAIDVASLRGDPVRRGEALQLANDISRRCERTSDNPLDTLAG